jgi:hypothetical protein
MKQMAHRHSLKEPKNLPMVFRNELLGVFCYSISFSFSFLRKFYFLLKGVPGVAHTGVRSCHFRNSDEEVLDHSNGIQIHGTAILNFFFFYNLGR